jgi:hypothetical protein
MPAAQGPFFFPNDQGLGYISSGPGSEPYLQEVPGPPGIASADGTIVMAQTGGTVDLSTKVALNALLSAIKTAVAGSGSTDAVLLAAVAAIPAQ